MERQNFNSKFQNPDGNNYLANILGVNAVHQGIEFDFTYRPLDDLSFYGMFSLGDWEWAK